MQKKSILVVEDEQPLVEVIRTKLEKSDFEVTSARSTQQALQYLQEKMSIDVIWLDHYLLGKENGLDFVIKIKAKDSPWKNIPIFLVSNTASPDKIKAYLGLGIQKYYTKADFRLENIIKDIQAVLSKME